MTRQSALSVTNSDAGDVSINFPRPLSPDFATQPIEPRWDQVEVLSIWRNAHDPTSACIEGGDAAMPCLQLRCKIPIMPISSNARGSRRLVVAQSSSRRGDAAPCRPMKQPSSQAPPEALVRCSASVVSANASEDERAARAHGSHLDIHWYLAPYVKGLSRPGRVSWTA